MTRGKVEVLPSLRADLPAVGRFLHRNLNRRLSAARWEQMMTPSWASTDGEGGAPDHGVHLRANGEVVGAYLAFYADRILAGQQVRVCNLAAWCVAPEYRAEALRLTRAMVRRRDLHFTDLSPSGNVVEINRRLGFHQLDTTTTATLCLPRRRGRVEVTSDHADLRSTLTTAERAVFDDHAMAPAAHHLLIRRGNDHAHLIWRRDRRKQVRAFASVLYTSNPELTSAAWPQVASALGTKHGVGVALVERRLLGADPAGSRVLASARPKMFRSSSLVEADIDYLYSELTNVAW